MSGYDLLNEMDADTAIELARLVTEDIDAGRRVILVTGSAFAANWLRQMFFRQAPRRVKLCPPMEEIDGDGTKVPVSIPIKVALQDTTLNCIIASMPMIRLAINPIGYDTMYFLAPVHNGAYLIEAAEKIGSPLSNENLRWKIVTDVSRRFNSGNSEMRQAMVNGLLHVLQAQPGMPSRTEVIEIH